MKKWLRRVIIILIRRTPLYHPLRNYRLRKRWKKEFQEWEASGRSAPPHLFKQMLLRNYAAKYGIQVMIETGTCYGDMVEAMKNVFERIISIELGEDLWKFARERFKRERHIEIIHGDSSKVLEKIVKSLRSPALFWLDAHYSGGETAKGENETPVLEELRHILSAQCQHVILIDDARFFGTNPAYPTLEELRSFIMQLRDDVEILVKDGIIRITPRYLSQDNNDKGLS